MWRILAGAILAIATLLLLSAPVALGALDHSEVEKEFEAAGCTNIGDIAIDEVQDWIYVSCNGRVKRFDFEGQPIPFAHAASYIYGNELTESPTSHESAGGSLSVDNSPNATQGTLVIVHGNFEQTMEAFAPSGQLIKVLPPENVSLYGRHPQAGDVGPNGEVIVITEESVTHGRIYEYDTPAYTNELRRIYALDGGNYVRIDSTGAVWMRHKTEPFGEKGDIRKYESDQWSTFLGAGFGTPEALWESLKATASPYVGNPLVANAGKFDIELITNDLYVNRGNRIEVYSPGNAEESAYQHAPEVGKGILSASVAVAVTNDHRVFASSGGTKIVRFGPGQIVPDVRTKPVVTDEVGHTAAPVVGRIDLDGGPNITNCELQYGLTTSYSSTPIPCTPDPAESPPGSNFSEPTDVTAEMTGLTTGATYHYRFVAENENGRNVGIDRTVVPPYVLKVRTLPAADIETERATLRGSFDADSMSTTYRFQYGPTESYGLTTESFDGGEEAGETEVEVPVSELASGKTWHYRIVAMNSGGSTFGPDVTFRTASAPTLSAVHATEVAATSARLHARINPVGYETSYRFEYGKSLSYGNSVPVQDGSIGSGTSPVEVSHKLEGLEAGATYHFRVVTSNKWGTTTSPDTTFDFSPPTCPNEHVRQQTRSSYLPDCRAYELVSPKTAGSAIFMPGELVWLAFGSSTPTQYAEWPQNTGRATSPARFTYWQGYGTNDELDGSVETLALILSTRTNDGWVNTTPTFKTKDTLLSGRKQCSEDMDLCIDHFENYGVPKQQAATVFRADGTQIDKWPTNYAVIPGGETFNGAQRPSPTFNHFAFASSDAIFAPGGLSGGIGSAYDNDVVDRTVSIISKLPGGGSILQDGPNSNLQRFEFPGISVDGSHILMRTPASGGRFHLYMRVSDALTYDVTRGTGGEFVGMTRDGSKVVFLSSAQLTLEDQDTSDDLYMWSDMGGTDELKVVSQGNGRGNVDTCSSVFSTKCGVAPLDTEKDHPHNRVSVGGIDDLVAEESGDVYFYSPELLDPSQAGIPNQRNLYVYRHGEVHLVAPLEQGKTVSRMQVSPDGSHAAIVTSSQLTAENNAGFKQMYTYDVEGDVIRCASCNPNGLPPESNVVASAGGPFMANDGRAFFATTESLVARDGNSGVIDVYEYVDGRPQLVTSGLGSRDFTGGQGASLYPGVNISLESVSRDGTDVFFSTYESLVPQDLNGEFVKFYDARTGGGFAADPGFAPCAAADECHGVDSSPPPPRIQATDVDLGSTGNLKPYRHSACAPGKIRRHRRCLSRLARARKACRHKQGRAKRRCVKKRLRRRGSSRKRRLGDSLYRDRAGREQ